MPQAFLLLANFFTMLEIIFIIPPGGNEILSPFDRFSGWSCSPGQTERMDVFDLACNMIEISNAHSRYCHEFSDPILS